MMGGQLDFSVAKNAKIQLQETKSPAMHYYWLRICACSVTIVIQFRIPIRDQPFLSKARRLRLSMKCTDAMLRRLHNATRDTNH